MYYFAMRFLKFGNSFSHKKFNLPVCRTCIIFCNITKFSQQVFFYANRKF